jgi:polyphosphate kinase
MTTNLDATLAGSPKADPSSDFTFNDRDLSWLAFNYRVLQEAKDLRVPLYERFKFMAIYSSNMDEFFKVRVAYLRGLATLKKKTQRRLDFDPVGTLHQLQRLIKKQRVEYAETFVALTEELKQHNIYFINQQQLSPSQQAFASEYFKAQVRPLLNPTFLHENVGPVFLPSDVIHHALRFLDNEGDYVYALIEIPTSTLPRFLLLPAENGQWSILALDDVIRHNIDQLFPKVSPSEVYSIKVTRDAELYIYDEFSGDLVEKIKKSLNKRNLGVPSRFLYDRNMPEGFLKDLKKSLALADDDLVSGGRYHNLRDLMGFPNPLAPELEYEKLPPLRVPALDQSPLMVDAILQRDWLIHFPYHSYDYLSRFLGEAAQDHRVSKIRISLYRVAVGNSKVVAALIEAAKRGIEVTVFVEVKARFDEENNIYWSTELFKAGAKVLYSIPGLKVHSKTCVITYNNPDGSQTRVAYFGTGNFNEKTARIYGDLGLFTANPALTDELLAHFDFLRQPKGEIATQQLLVAPHGLRTGLYHLINREIAEARSGQPAYMLLKMNSVQDREMIAKLYEASNAGVKIDLIVRGICCLQPGVPGQSTNIRIISIVDRFLEHARMYLFHHGGEQRLYCSSADLMTRNLNDRVEVAFPVLDPDLKQEVIDLLNIQLADNQKARIIDRKLTNKYVKTKAEPLRAQYAIYWYLKNKYGV